VWLRSPLGRASAGTHRDTQGCGRHPRSCALMGSGLRESDELRGAFGRLATGVCVVTAAGPDGPAGMTCNSVISVSLEPPLVLFCPAKTSTTWPVMREAASFAINILGSDAGLTARRFATRGEDRFASTSWSAGQTGAPLLTDAIVWVECETSARHDCRGHE